MDEEVNKILKDEIIISKILLDTAAINALSLFGKNICLSLSRPSPLTGEKYTYELLACVYGGRIK